MRESHLRRHLDFICFVQETENYPMTERAEQLARDVLDDDLSGDEAISEIMDFYHLVKADSGLKTADACYPGTEVFINYFDIKDQDELDIIETEIVAVRMAEILKGPQEWKFDFDHLKTLHTRLFDDIYPFAGVVRYIPITPRTIFCLPQFIHTILDGNTRTSRLFFQQLSHAAGWRMNPSDTSDSRLLEADIAALEGDYQPLISILHEAVEPL